MKNPLTWNNGYPGERSKTHDIAVTGSRARTFLSQSNPDYWTFANPVSLVFAAPEACDLICIPFFQTRKSYFLLFM